jgi:hypothetical protein
MREIKNDWKQQALLNIITDCKWLQCLIQRHGITNLVKKQDPTTCCLQDTHITRKQKEKRKL